MNLVGRAFSFFLTLVKLSLHATGVVLAAIVDLTLLILLPERTSDKIMNPVWNFLIDSL